MDVRQRLNSFGTGSLQGILSYHWSDFVSNERLLRKTQIRFVTCIVRERQLRLYGHVARFPDADPAHQILSPDAHQPRVRRRPMGDHVLRGCSMVIGISRSWGWASHLPGGWSDGGPWSTGSKLMQRCAALAHAPRPDLT